MLQDWVSPSKILAPANHSWDGKGCFPNPQVCSNWLYNVMIVENGVHEMFESITITNESSTINSVISLKITSKVGLPMSSFAPFTTQVLRHRNVTSLTVWTNAVGLSACAAWTHSWDVTRLISNGSSLVTTTCTKQVPNLRTWARKDNNQCIYQISHWLSHNPVMCVPKLATSFFPFGLVSSPYTRSLWPRFAHG